MIGCPSSWVSGDCERDWGIAFGQVLDRKVVPQVLAQQLRWIRWARNLPQCRSQAQPKRAQPGQARHHARTDAIPMLRRLSIGLLASAVGIAPLGQPLLLVSTAALATVAMVVSPVAALALSAEDYVREGIKKRKSGDFQEAIDDFNKALVIDQQNARAYFERGFTKRWMGDYKSAIDDYNNAIDIDPANEVFFNNRGFAKQLLVSEKGANLYSITQEAIADYTVAISLDPQFVLAYTNRGMAKASLNDYQGAIVDFSKVVEINPRDPVAFSNRGLAKGRSGDDEGACEDFTRAIDLGDTYALALFHDNCDQSGDI